jgi:hypothetical protein
MKTKVSTDNPVKKVVPTDIEGFDSLDELALDMRWAKTNKIN